MNDIEDEYDALDNVITRLLNERIPLENIVILTPSVSKDSSCWNLRQTQHERYQLVWDLNPSHGQITCNTIHSFKGLERPVIILTELKKLTPQAANEMLYIATSRAKDHLISLGNLPILR